VPFCVRHNLEAIFFNYRGADIAEVLAAARKNFQRGFQANQRENEANLLLANQRQAVKFSIINCKILKLVFASAVLIPLIIIPEVKILVL
jgi:hypothetical protein